MVTVSNVYTYSNGLGGTITYTDPNIQIQPTDPNSVIRPENQVQYTNVYSLIPQYFPYVMNDSYYYNLQQPQTYTQQPAQQVQTVNNYHTYKLDDKLNKAENYNNWTDDIGMNPNQAAYQFKIKSDDTKKKADYMKDLESIAQDYIKMYDTDEDGKITFDEFWEKELANAEEKLDEIDKDDKKALKKQMKTVFNRLNVTNARESKNVLTKAEIMNMFMTIDGTNSNENADGYITKNEFMIASYMLADSSKDENSDGNLYSKRLKQTYKRFFHGKY